uniref:Solute carrier family 13 member 5 n=1 Tax=Plectus sambesii TaxID=2011161 RepID=A0A914WV04_9BILA
MLGFMAVTAFLSMWISNTATTAMMVPIAIAVLEKLTENSNPNNIALLERGSNRANASNSTAVARRNTERFPEKKDELRKKSLADITLNYEQMTPQDRGVCKAILLSICYAANIGGTGTLTGTGPNLVLRGQLDAYYKGADTGITFATWMGFEIPPLIVYLISAWLLLQVVFMTPEWLGGRKKQKKVESKDDVAAMIKRSYEELGAMKFIEWSTLFWFLLLVVLWVMRDPRFVPGWAAWFGERSNDISDASAAMFVACVMFAWPKEAPDFFCLRKDKHQVAQKRESLVTWAIIQRKFPWSVIMLLGGGFALAEGVRESKLSSWIGCELQHALHTLPTPAILAIFTIIITFVTEVTSNTATASIFIPIMLSIAENLKINPLYFALPATIAPSFAFMLPVATPPNAIVYEVGALRIIDMMIAGFFMNWLAIAATLININTYGYFFYDLGTYPIWASQANRTSIC